MKFKVGDHVEVERDGVVGTVVSLPEDETGVYEIRQLAIYSVAYENEMEIADEAFFTRPVEDDIDALNELEEMVDAGPMFYAKILAIIKECAAGYKRGYKAGRADERASATANWDSY